MYNFEFRFLTEADFESFFSSAEEQLFSLIDKIKKDGEIVLSEAEVEKIFNALKPIKPSFLIGEWDGGGLDTGHPAYGKLKESRWAGKNFVSEDDGDPVMVLDDAGKRVFNEDWGHSSVSLSNALFYLLLLTTPLHSPVMTNSKILVARNGVSWGGVYSHDL